MSGQSGSHQTVESLQGVAELISTMLGEQIAKCGILSISSDPVSTFAQKEVTLSLPQLVVTRGKTGEVEVLVYPNFELKIHPDMPKGTAELRTKDGSNVRFEALGTESETTPAHDLLATISVSVCLSMSSFSNSSRGTS